MKKFQPLLLALLLPAMVLAQETTADISGTVFLVDGKTGLSSATVVALHTPTGTKYTTTTRADGRFNFPNLRIGGPYTVMVTYVGYKEEKQESINLLLGQEFKMNFTLLPEHKLLDSVVVASKQQNKAFSPSRMGMQEIINRSQIERLPTIARSLQDFTKLEPTSNGLSFGGRSNQYNNVTVDGANFNNSFGLSGTLGGQTGSQPISLDAIEQIQVNISPYDVTQGGFSGAGINSVTRSGTNQFKASAYGYIRNQNLQGYNIANTNIAKTAFYNTTRGFTVGGPIIKNKLFFFLSAEQAEQSAPATSFTASSATNAPGDNVSQANADTLDKLKQFLIDKFEYDPGAYQGYNFKTKSDKITAKVDWNINSKNTLTIKYNYLKSSSDQFASSSRPGNITVKNHTIIGGGNTGKPGLNSMPFYGSGYTINNNFDIFIAELNTRLSNTLSNKLQIGYTALRDFRTPHTSIPFPFVDILNGNGQVYTSFGYEPYTYNNLLNTDLYQFSDIVKWYKGAHEITFGTQNYYRKYKNAFAPGYQGVYQFNTLTDFYNSVNNGISNARNYSLQYSALPDGNFPFAEAGSTELSLFAQDKWKATKNFTLTYGLRIDYTIFKQAFTDNPYFNALKFKNDAQYNIGKAPANKPLLSPRVGFNWDVMNDKTLQIRGGLGVFAGTPPFVWISNQASNNGVQFGSFTDTTKVFSANPAAHIPYPASSPTAYNIAITDRNFKYPQVLKGSIAIDKRLSGDFILTFEATGTKDINAVFFENINLNETTASALGGADNRPVYNSQYYTGNPVATLTNPKLGTVILMRNTSKGYAYTATLRAQKTIQNLYLSVAYTYSKAQTVAEGRSTADEMWKLRPNVLGPNTPILANASFYQPHRVIASASYRIEYAKYYSTSIGLIFEAAPSGVGSYVYDQDLNGDGVSGNDLIYIPRSADEINLVKVGSGANGTNTANVNDSRTGTIGTGAPTDRSKSIIWNQLNNFINQDDYLSNHRGEYAKANAVVFPFYKQVDLNITQDFSIKTGKDRHTLRLTLDIINLGNLLNKYWGIRQLPTITNILKYEGMGANNKPSFSFPYLDANNQVPLTNSFINNTNVVSRWQMQFGVRYLFN